MGGCCQPTKESEYLCSFPIVQTNVLDLIDIYLNNDLSTEQFNFVKKELLIPKDSKSKENLNNFWDNVYKNRTSYKDTIDIKLLLCFLAKIPRQEQEKSIEEIGNVVLSSTYYMDGMNGNIIKSKFKIILVEYLDFSTILLDDFHIAFSKKTQIDNEEELFFNRDPQCKSDFIDQYFFDFNGKNEEFDIMTFLCYNLGKLRNINQIRKEYSVFGQSFFNK